MIQNKIAVTTIVANNYLGFALTLFESLVKNEYLDLVVLLTDGLSDEVDYSVYPYKFVDVNDLNICRLEELAFKYDIVEFSTALKPFMLEYLMDNAGYEKVFYIDPDIYFFDDFNEVVEDLGEHSVMLTPHLVDSTIGLGNSQFEKTCLLDGIFNLGFVGFSNNPEAHDILHWWQERLLEFCYNDEKYFTDQKWVNFFPTLFNDVFICRKKTYNFAEWNFYERYLTSEGNKYFISENNEKRRLVFCHFSGYKANDPKTFLQGSRIVMNEDCRDDLISLYGFYKGRLEANLFKEYCSIKYRYNVYDNGIAITELQRRMFRKLLDMGYKIHKPFSTGENSLFQIYIANKLVIKETDIKNTVFDNTRVTQKSSIIKKMNSLMLLGMKMVGVKKYCMLLRYFNHYCTVDDQIFLLKKMLPDDKVIGE